MASKKLSIETRTHYKERVLNLFIGKGNDFELDEKSIDDGPEFITPLLSNIIAEER